MSHRVAQYLVRTLLITGVFSLCSCQAELPTFTVDAPQVRALIPGRDTTAGYFILTNNSTGTVTLAGAESELARAIEMHESYTDGDFVRMRPLKNVALGPGETITFAPGGKHLMIFGTREVPETFPITLIFSNGKRRPVTFSRLNF